MYHGANYTQTFVIHDAGVLRHLTGNESFFRCDEVGLWFSTLETWSPDVSKLRFQSLFGLGLGRLSLRPVLAKC